MPDAALEVRAARSCENCACGALRNRDKRLPIRLLSRSSARRMAGWDFAANLKSSAFTRGKRAFPERVQQVLTVFHFGTQPELLRVLHRLRRAVS